MSSCLNISLDKYLCLFFSIIKILMVFTQHAPTFGFFDLLFQVFLKFLFLFLLLWFFLLCCGPAAGKFLFSMGWCYVQSIYSPPIALQPQRITLQDRPVRLLSFPALNFKHFWEKNGPQSAAEPLWEQAMSRALSLSAAEVRAWYCTHSFSVLPCDLH